MNEIAIFLKMVMTLFCLVVTGMALFMVVGLLFELKTKLDNWRKERPDDE